MTAVSPVTGQDSSSVGGTTLELARLAKALGHPIRVQIVQLLAARTRCYCGDLVYELPLAQATVSQHLKVLRDAGLIQGETDGPRVCYCLNPDRLEAFGDLLSGLLVEARATDRDCCDSD